MYTIVYKNSPKALRTDEIVIDLGLTSQSTVISMSCRDIAFEFVGLIPDVKQISISSLALSYFTKAPGSASNCPGPSWRAQSNEGKQESLDGCVYIKQQMG